MNWLDVVFGLILAASVAAGFSKGLLRIGIGFGAVILGFLIASWSYGSVGYSLRHYVPTKQVANFLGFLLVFFLILAIGALTGALLARIFKLVGLSWLDRLLGGAFGIVRGLFICVIILMVLLAFSPSSTRAAVANSTLAPYAMEASSVLAAVTPHEIKDGFKEGYDTVKQAWAETFKKKHKKEKESSESKDML